MMHNTLQAPAWFTSDLPYPIAHAWHLAQLEARPDAMAIAGAVEVALRFVGALQLADLAAQQLPFPQIFTNGEFTRPTLGGWIRAVKELRAANRTPCHAMLARWPERATVAALDDLVTTRNTLGHPGAMTPRQRAAHTERIAELAVEIIKSLDWLRTTYVIGFIDAMATGPVTFDGGIQFYHGAGNLHPKREPYRWTGVVPIGSLFFLPSEPHAASGRLVPLSPWVDVSALRPGLPENFSLVSAVGSRGDIQVWDEAAGVRVWRQLPNATGYVPIELKTVRAPQSAGTEFIDTLHMRDRWPHHRQKTSIFPTRSRRLVVMSALLGIIVAATAVAFVIAATMDSKSSSTGTTSDLAITREVSSIPGPSADSERAPSNDMPPHAPPIAPPDEVPRHPTPQPEMAVQAPAVSLTQAPGGPADTTPRPPARNIDFKPLQGTTARSTQLPKAMKDRMPGAPPASDGPDDACAPPDMHGNWTFETTVLGTSAEHKNSLGVNGFYQLQLEEPVGCAMRSVITKSGFTVKKAVRNVAFQDTPDFIVSTTNDTISGLAMFRTSPDAAYSTDISFRFTTAGDHLVGLWRHEGLARAKAGLWGGLHGHRAGANPPEHPKCFLSCVSACHGDRDAEDTATEKCLMSCAPALLNCEG